MQPFRAAAQYTLVAKWISGKKSLLKYYARVSLWQTDELLKLNHARYVGEVGIVETCHFVFQKKRKVNLVQRAQPFDGKHGSSCPGNPPADDRYLSPVLQVPLRLTASCSARVS